MAYPTLPQGLDSKEVQNLGRVGDRASNGALKLRSFFTAVKRSFQITHPKLTAAQKTTLEAYYAANSTLSFSFTFDAGGGATYTVRFGTGDLVFTPQSYNTWSTVVSLEEV